MGSAADVADLERRGWEALATGPREARSFYDAVLAEDAQMLFPGGMRLVGKGRVLETMGGRPWASFEISELQVLDLSGTAKTVTYEVVAQREGEDPYRALICSTYVLRSGEWRLVVHQHTPE